MKELEQFETLLVTGEPKAISDFYQNAASTVDKDIFGQMNLLLIDDKYYKIVFSRIGKDLDFIRIFADTVVEAPVEYVAEAFIGEGGAEMAQIKIEKGQNVRISEILAVMLRAKEAKRVSGC